MEIAEVLTSGSITGIGSMIDRRLAQAEFQQVVTYVGLLELSGQPLL